ncbi:MAG TPA: BrnA antitoxin family protein, partial [Acetobacteraceae bacterium]
ELERQIAADPDFRDIPRNWFEVAEAVMPVPKRLLFLRIDSDVVDWFRAQGPGYQTRINAVLKAFMKESRRKRA